MPQQKVSLAATTQKCVCRYPVPPKAETKGFTDDYVGSWLRSQKRDSIVLASKVCSKFAIIHTLHGTQYCNQQRACTALLLSLNACLATQIVPGHRICCLQINLSLVHGWVSIGGLIICVLPMEQICSINAKQWSTWQAVCKSRLQATVIRPG